MFSLALAVVLSQHGPKIIDLNKPVPVLRQENVVRPGNSASVTRAGTVPKPEKADPPAAPVNSNSNSNSAQASPTAAPSTAATDPAKDEQLKELERRQQELLKRAAANDALWRKSVNALAGEH